MKQQSESVTRYRSKIDWWYHLTVWLFAGLLVVFLYGTVSPNATQEQKAGYALPTLFLGAIWLFFLVPIYLQTYYEFRPDCLYIRSGLGTRMKIPYYEIRSCEPSTQRANLSAALSKDKLTLTYMKGSAVKTVAISPADKFDFSTALKLAKKPREEQD